MIMGTHADCTGKGRIAIVPALVRRMRGASRAQSVAELAMVLPLLLVLLLAGIQFAIIGAAALALGQVNYQGARYAAVTATADQSAVKTYMVNASPTIGANSGAYLTATLSPAPPCTQGSPVTVSVTFDANHLLALPNPFLKVPPFFPGINFPTTLSSSETAFCEGSNN